MLATSILELHLNVIDASLIACCIFLRDGRRSDVGPVDLHQVLSLLQSKDRHGQHKRDDKHPAWVEQDAIAWRKNLAKNLLNLQLLIHIHTMTR